MPNRSSLKPAGAVSQRVIAERLGVSPAAVAYALNGKAGVSPALRARICEVADELGYTRNMHARALRTGRTGMVALMIRDFSNPYFLDVIAGAQVRALDSDVTVLTVDAGSSIVQEEYHIRRLAAQSIDGLAISPMGAGDSVRLWQELRPETPLVLMNTVIPSLNDVVSVSADRRGAAIAVLDHLRDLGHTEVWLVDHPASVLQDKERRLLFEQLGHDRGIACRVIDVSMGGISVYESMRRLFSSDAPPRAVAASSDHYAVEVYAAARDSGLRVGRDVTVIGQDDLPTSRLLDPPLTTVAVDRRSIGSAAASRLIAHELGNHTEPVQLIVRQSSGSAKP